MPREERFNLVGRPSIEIFQARILILIRTILTHLVGTSNLGKDTSSIKERAELTKKSPEAFRDQAIDLTYWGDELQKCGNIDPCIARLQILLWEGDEKTDLKRNAPIFSGTKIPLHNSKGKSLGNFVFKLESPSQMDENSRIKSSQIEVLDEEFGLSKAPLSP
ncbi:hypothetical protein Tco_1288501 [Tanacetum coccineum]